MKRGATILGIFTLLFFSFAHAQQRWERTYGGASDEDGRSVQQTQDGGYIVVGYTYSFGNESQVYLIKTNASGGILWTRNYGGASFDHGYSVQQTQDGGYIVAGYTYSFGNSWQVYLIKTNASGDTLWTKTYGGANGDYGYSVQQTTDGGYIIAGETWLVMGIAQVYLVKTNVSGGTLWTRIYVDTTGYNAGNSVQQTSDGGYIIAGTYDYGGANPQVYLIKTNASGDTLWSRTYGGTNWDKGYSVQQTSDGGYIIGGFTSSFGAGSYDVYLIKTNATGDTLWTRTYGGTGDDGGYSVQQTQDGGYIVAGWNNSFGNGAQVYLVKTDASGDTLWTRNYGGTDYDYGRSVQQTTDGGYVIAGQTNSFGNSTQVYLVKTDANGNVGVETPVRQLDGSTVRQLKATPNPFTSFATLPGHEGERFSLYDVSGRRVGTYRGDRVGEGLAPGVYFLREKKGSEAPVRVVKIR
jgi:hypothetical protein